MSELNFNQKEFEDYELEEFLYFHNADVKYIGIGKMRATFPENETVAIYKRKGGFIDGKWQLKEVKDLTS